MKTKIIQIGRMENGNPVNWSFDSYTSMPALSVSGEGILYYGYTARELEEIYQNNQQTLSKHHNGIKTSK